MEEMGTFDILNNINEHVSLVQLINSLSNANNTLSVVGKWIFDSNNEKALPLTIELLKISFACSDESQYFSNFQELFYAVIYVNPNGKSNRVQKWFDIIMNIYICIYDIIILVATRESYI